MNFGLVTERGDAELAADPRPEPGGRVAPGPPAPARGRLHAAIQAARGSVWAPVALRVAGIAAMMLGLAGIGAASIMAAPPGLRIDASALSQHAEAGAAWLAADPGGGQQHAPPPPAAGDGGAASSGGGVTADGKVILNAASAEELTRLPGVGRRRAEAIVELRTRLKRFRKATDLLRVRGIGPKSLRRMLPHLVVDPPTAPATDGG